MSMERKANRGSDPGRSRGMVFIGRDGSPGSGIQAGHGPCSESKRIRCPSHVQGDRDHTRRMNTA